MDYEEIWNMSEEELEQKYRAIVSGFDEVEVGQVPSPVCKIVSDFSEATDVSERHKFLLTIVYQNIMLRKLQYQYEDLIMRYPTKIPADIDEI